MTDTARPHIDFYTFIVSLGSSALVHLGDAPHPETQQTGTPDLPLAQQTIDVLAMLREKTKGNLSPEEEQLFDHLLRDLKLRYVERARGQQG
jgi:hypothetical protein